MKKILSIMLVGTSLLLVGCSKKSEKNSSENSMTQSEWVKKNSKQQKISFENGVLKTNDFELKIDKAQFAENIPGKQFGLILWYTVTNNSKSNIIPYETLKYFSIKQKDATSEFEVSNYLLQFDSALALFPDYDQDGKGLQDYDAYEKAQNQRQEFHNTYEIKSTAELLPGKTIQVVSGMSINNKDYPVTFKVNDQAASPNEIFSINP